MGECSLIVIEVKVTTDIGYLTTFGHNFTLVGPFIQPNIVPPNVIVANQDMYYLSS